MNSLMRSIALLLTSALLVAPVASAAQDYWADISVFSDPLGSSCSLLDGGVAPFNVYVLCRPTPGIGLVGSRFRISSSPGFGGEYVSETIHLPFFVGDLFAGIEVGYAWCYTTDLLVATIAYMGHGTSQPCSELAVFPHPQTYTGDIEVMDCYFEWLHASTVGPLLVNPVDGHCEPACAPVRTESKTWGKVKSLYR